MNNNEKKRLLQVLNFLFAFFFVALANAQPENAGPGVDRLFAQAHSGGAVRVIVKLDTQPVMGSTRRGTALLTKKQRIQHAADGVLNRMRPAGKRGIKRFRHLPLLALETTPDGLREILASPEILAVYEDRKLLPGLDDSVPLIGGDTAHAAGYAGAGHAVAILDTGVDAAHPFLWPRVVSEACYSTTSPRFGSTTVCPNGGQSQTGSGAGAPCDVNGCDHGTHVAGIAAGNGATFDGVARGADIIGIQVFSQFNSELDCGAGQTRCIAAFTSDIIQGLERVYDLRNSLNIAAANLSMSGGTYTSPCDSDPMKDSIDLLRTAGIATVASSGNDGSTNDISTPACISTAVAVGSTTKNDTLSFFSNSSPLVDLLAPGSDIRSSVPGGGFATLSGTSMAAPHVTGAFALLRSARPTATVDEILAALVNTGEPVIDNANSLVKPRIQVDQAIGALGAGVNGELEVMPENDFIASGPVGGPFTPASKTYTLSNSGAEALDYTVVSNADFFDTSPSAGQLPAGGSDTVTLTLNAFAEQLAPGNTTGSFAVNGIIRKVELTVTLPGGLNDDFTEAAEISATLPVSIDATSEDATKEAGEPMHAGNIGGASVWWSWIAAHSGTVVIDTLGSNFDTLLAVYRGTALDNLVEVASNDDSVSLQSRVSLDVASGEVFWIAVDGYNADTGNIKLNLNANNQAPVADASGPYTGTAGVTVNFDGSDSSDPDGSIASYVWNFGDGESGSGATPTHTYDTAGTYTVTVTVTDNDGATDSDTSSASILSGERSQTAISAASLPSGRSVQVGNLASVFATIINSSNTAAIGCSIAPQTSVAASFTYKATDASNVASSAAPNSPVDIPAGGSQNFTFAFTPTAPINPVEVFMTYDCVNSQPAQVTVGLNTLLLTASSNPVPDIVALARTPSSDGILNLAGTSASNAFAVSTINVGSTATITASPRTSGPLNVTLTICETNPSTGTCLFTPGSSTTRSLNGGATPTYSVFVTATGDVPFDPANNRIIVEFKDAGGVVRGATSVAVQTL